VDPVSTTDAAPLGLPRNYLRPCLLLLLAEGEAHGYDLLEQVAELGIEQADPGGLYRTLRAMEQDGLVTSWWEPSDVGPRRRTYSLTEDGRDWLHVSAVALREARSWLDRYLVRYERHAGQVDLGADVGADASTGDPTR
jgi:PadR family transcriptional regulator, regulatory protein PadR